MMVYAASAAAAGRKGGSLGMHYCEIWGYILMELNHDTTYLLASKYTC